MDRFLAGVRPPDDAARLLRNALLLKINHWHTRRMKRPYTHTTQNEVLRFVALIKGMAQSVLPFHAEEMGGANTTAGAH